MYLGGARRFALTECNSRVVSVTEGVAGLLLAHLTVSEKGVSFFLVYSRRGRGDRPDRGPAVPRLRRLHLWKEEETEAEEDERRGGERLLVRPRGVPEQAER